MNTIADQLFLLSVGVEPAPESSDWIQVYKACSARDAIVELRTAKVDLLLAGPEIPDMTIWKLVEKIRAARPGQKWAMIDLHLTAETEIRARSLGAMFVCNEMPDCAQLHELARTLLKKSAAEKDQHGHALLEMN